MTSTTYEINGNNNCSYNRTEYDMNRESKEKDILISQLKAKIFELELHEKDYDMLNERYKQLQNEFSSLNDCKHHLEYEKKLKDEELNKHINELQCENENLQIGFNEKLSNNKNLFSQNNILGKQIQLKDAEIYNLISKLNDLENQLNRNNGERANLQKVLNGLEDIKNNQNIKISQLIEDNKILKQICQEQEQNIKLSNQEKQQMSGELDDKNNNIQELNYQIKTQINNLNNLQNQYNKNNSINLQYQNNLKDYERQIDLLKEENDNLKDNLIKEKSIRTEEDSKCSHLSDILNDREQKINELCHDIENIKMIQENASNTNNVLEEENGKLRNHIMVLTEQNQNLINEIDNVIEEDEKAINILNRKDRISSLLMSNRSTIDQSLNNLDECINNRKGFSCKTSFSNTYEYN
jgi:chromosome segregation ATPase